MRQLPVNLALICPLCLSCHSHVLTGFYLTLKMAFQNTGGGGGNKKKSERENEITTFVLHRVFHTTQSTLIYIIIIFSLSLTKVNVNKE